MSVQVKGSGTIGGLDEGLVVSGIVTSSTQINVGSNIKLGNAGVITATSFVGSGANLTSLPSQVTINNASGNRVITSDGGTTLNCEDTLRYDGTNFLIGTNTEAPYNNRNLTVAAGGSGNSTVAIEIRSPSNGTGRVIFSDGTSADSSANEGQVIYQQSDHKMLFGVAANYQNMALESTGGTGADLNLIDGNLKFASGHGIDFSATSDASGMASELFDDYEEGTFTPTLDAPNQSGTTFVHFHNHGYYTKIGNVVTVAVYIQGYASGNASGGSNDDVKIINLPFAPAILPGSGSSNRHNANWTFGTTYKVEADRLEGYTYGGNTYIDLLVPSNGGTGTMLKSNQIDQNTCQFWCEATYRV